MAGIAAGAGVGSGVPHCPPGSADWILAGFRQAVRKPRFREIGGVNQLYRPAHGTRHVVFTQESSTGDSRERSL